MIPRRCLWAQNRSNDGLAVVVAVIWWRRRWWAVVIMMIVVVVRNRNVDCLNGLGGLHHGRMAAGKGQHCGSQQKGCRHLDSSHRVVLLGSGLA